MKRTNLNFVVLMLILLLDVSGSVAQEYEDVVYLKNGGVRRGLIFEQIPGESIKLKTSYGEIFVIEMLDISKIVKEEKKLTKRIIYGSEERSKSKLESWYAYWALGVSRTKFSDSELNDMMDLLEAFPGVSRTRLSLDMLGFYWPTNPNTVVGVVVNGATDHIDDSEAYLRLNVYTYSVSALYFPEIIGRGIFYRADIGPAVSGIEGYVPGFFSEEVTSDTGFGFLLGGGYAHPITEGTRITANVNYAIRKIEGDSWNTLGISIGGIF
ncbi:MAG: hypothetical protein VX294_11995 [Candidatus Latescibacterota bacterium]|nr:hypothetical protein [Candidatus Latescibacterota bacterium]